MNNKIILIFPPGWTPFAPSLALPQLKGYLNEYKLDVDIVDDNIIFFDKILNQGYLQNKCNKLIEIFDLLNNKNILSNEEHLLYKKLLNIKVYERKVKSIDRYKKCLRSYGNNIDKKAYEEVMQVFSVALEIVNIFYNQVIDFTDIEFKKYRRNNINDVLSALKDKKNNIFVDYYTEIRIDLIDKLVKYELVGFSITSIAQLIPALTLCRLLKERKKNLIIYLGGNYITRLVQQREDNLEFLFEFIDFISCYEGEYTLKELLLKKVTKVNIDKEKEKICNIVYYKNNRIKINEIRDFKIRDVKCPNFDGFNLKLYFNPILILPLFTTKNCYSNCAFCTISGGTGGGKYKIMNINKVYEHMNRLKEKYNTKYFTFVDETFTFKRMLELSKKIVLDNNNDFIWYAETRFDYPMNQEEGKLLYKGGLRKLQFGLESYNQRILDLMNKNIRIETIRPILENCIKNSISFHLFYILGFPKETREEAIKTVKFVEDIINEAERTYNLHECSKGLSAFGLEKGSQVYNSPDEYGIEIISDENNKIGLQYAYNSKSGLNECESIQMMSEIIENLNCKIGIRIPITRLLSEEMSIFFIEKSIEKFYTYKFKEDFESESHMKLRYNPFSEEEGECYLYYNYEDSISLIFKNSSENLTSFEKSLLKAYAFMNWKSLKHGISKSIKLNPFIKYVQQKNANVIAAYDSISGDKYELNILAYEVIQIIDKLSYNEAERLLIDNKIFTKKEFICFMNTVSDARLLIVYSLCIT